MSKPLSPTLRGILWMLGAMAGFALGDVGIKLLAGLVPQGQIMITLGLFGALIFGLWTRARGLVLLPRQIWHPAVLARFGFEMLAGIGMVMALTTAPLSLTTAILQATPLVVAMGAALIFGEEVGAKRWSAILIGLLGVLIVIRPGLNGFDPASLWAVLAMLGLASRDLATRAAPASLDTLQLATFGVFALFPTGLILLPFGTDPLWPNAWQALILTGTVLTTVAGYYAITAAMRTGAVAAVTPARYSRLIFGLAFGMALFGERPDALAYFGAALIVAAGLYTIWREHRLRSATPS